MIYTNPQLSVAIEKATNGRGGAHKLAVRLGVSDMDVTRALQCRYLPNNQPPTSVLRALGLTGPDVFGRYSCAEPIELRLSQRHAA